TSARPSFSMRRPCMSPGGRSTAKGARMLASMLRAPTTGFLGLPGMVPVLVVVAEFGGSAVVRGAGVQGLCPRSRPLAARENAVAGTGTPPRSADCHRSRTVTVTGAQQVSRARYSPAAGVPAARGPPTTCTRSTDHVHVLSDLALVLS